MAPLVATLQWPLLLTWINFNPSKDSSSSNFISSNYTKHYNVTYMITQMCSNTCAFIKLFIWILFTSNFPGATREAIALIVLDKYSIMMLVKFSDLSQSDRSNWVMWQVKDPCPRPGWDGCLTREKIAFIKSVKTWIILLYIWLHL